MTPDPLDSLLHDAFGSDDPAAAQQPSSAFFADSEADARRAFVAASGATKYGRGGSAERVRTGWASSLALAAVVVLYGGWAISAASAVYGP